MALEREVVDAILVANRDIWRYACQQCMKHTDGADMIDSAPAQMPASKRQPLALGVELWGLHVVASKAVSGEGFKAVPPVGPDQRLATNAEDRITTPGTVRRRL